MVAEKMHIRRGPPDLANERADTMCGKTLPLRNTTAIGDDADCKRCLPIWGSNRHVRDRIANPPLIRLCAWYALIRRVGAPGHPTIGPTLLEPDDIAEAAAEIEARIDPATAMVVARFRAKRTDLEVILDAIDEALADRT